MSEELIRRINALERAFDQLHTDELATYAVASLPVSAANGAVIYVSDGPKADEAVGSGTGNKAMWRNSTSEWLYYGVGSREPIDSSLFLSWRGSIL